jgi:ATP-binding cassette subfamily C (CFTR/MRP) protein 1
LPRLCNIGFTFGQPFLITAVLELLYQDENSETRRKGYQLVALTLVIYTGIAVTSVHGSQALYRFIAMFRGATVSLIYEKSLLRSDIVDSASAVSLMSNDVDSIAFNLELLNECWARSIELAIGIFLLTRQLGWVSIMPIVVVLCKSR